MAPMFGRETMAPIGRRRCLWPWKSPHWWPVEVTTGGQLMRMDLVEIFQYG